MKLLTIGTLALAAFTATMHAESLKVEIPFDFTAGGRSLPAGTYSIQSDSMSKTPNFVLVGNGKVVSILTTKHQLNFDYRDPGVKFSCAAAGCVLSEIRTSSYRAKLSAPPAQHVEFIAMNRGN